MMPSLLRLFASLAALWTLALGYHFKDMAQYEDSEYAFYDVVFMDPTNKLEHSKYWGRYCSCYTPEGSIHMECNRFCCMKARGELSEDQERCHNIKLPNTFSHCTVIQEWRVTLHITVCADGLDKPLKTVRDDYYNGKDWPPEGF